MTNADTPPSRVAHRTEDKVILRILRQYLLPQTGVILLAFLFMVISAAMTGALASLMEPIIDDIFTNKNSLMLWPIAGAVFAAFILRGGASYVHGILLNNVGQKIILDIQSKLFQNTVRQDMAFYHEQPVGNLISMMTSDVLLLRNGVSDTLTGIGKSFVTLVVLLGVMFVQDWKLAAIAVGVFPITAYFVAKIGKRLKKVARITQDRLGDFASLLSDSFQGIRHVKAYTMETERSDKVTNRASELFELYKKAFQVQALTVPMNEALSGLAIVAVIVYGGLQVMDGDSTAGSFFSFITAFLMAYEPMKKLGKMNSIIQTGKASAERVFEVMDLTPTITSKPDAVSPNFETAEVTFEHVGFSYGETGTIQALRDVSVTLKSGSLTALVGPSGAGKSTFLNLIPRFYDVTSGQICINDTDIRDIDLAHLRRHIALVSQDVVLFQDTVAVNIGLGRPEASMEEIHAAASAAHCMEFIKALPEGFDTVIGSAGHQLSGGQRQRLAIARAFLKNAPILLLDEATSALDQESERTIQAALEHLRHNRTTLVIAHRLSTIQTADTILVLSHGQIVQSGTHESLSSTQGLYRNLYYAGFSE